MWAADVSATVAVAVGASSEAGRAAIYDIVKNSVASAFDDSASTWWHLVNRLVFVAIVLSVGATVMETVPKFDHDYRHMFDTIEVATIAIFTVELTLRIWCADAASSPFGRRRHPRLAYVLSPSGIIDLLSVVPFYLGATNLVVLRSLRLVRIFRVLKLTRQARAMRLLGQAIHARRDELLSLLTIVLLALLISATVMYSAEHEAQPKTFGSIPQSLWWSVATLTTVGYGDIYPVTVLGRVCASFIMLLGIGLVALPTGLLGSAMYELLTLKTCPRCGAELRPHEAHLAGTTHDEQGQRDRDHGGR